MMHPQAAIINEFNLQDEHVRTLKSYYLLHWQFIYLIRKLNDDGTLTHSGVTYIPVWYEGYASFTPQTQVKLSFREQAADSEYNYVLIRTK